MRVVLCIALLAASGSARADDVDQAAAAGNFFTLGVSPKTPASHAETVGGYDTARGGAIVELEAEARLHERLQLAVDGTYEGPNASLEPRVVAQVGLLDEDDQGIELSVFGGWEHEGFNGVPAVLGSVAVARHVAETFVAGSTAIGFGTDRSERYGEATLGAIRPLADRLYGGVEARVRLDLQHATDPMDEDAWAIDGGPVASYVAGPVAIIASTGVSALRQHTKRAADVGGFARLGVGTAF